MARRIPRAGSTSATNSSGREADKVWLASFHLTGVAQDWYFVMEQEAGGIANITWERFRMLCHERFGPAFGTNHLSDVVHLAFRGSVEDYIQAFQVRMVHVGHLEPLQWAHRFTDGLLDAIHMDVELQMPQGLQHAMFLVRTYVRRNALAPPRQHPGHQLPLLLPPSL